jgi:TonB family protein
MATVSKGNNSARQSDLLLWVAGGVIAAVGVAWLVILQPWAGSPEAAAATAPTVTLAVADVPPPTEEPLANAETTALDNPLRMAELAYDAGMLVEPEEYSAWTLYSKVIKSDAGNAAALEGLAKVADDLVRRGETALEQGRFDDARSTVERIRAVLPEHEGAKALADKIWPDVGVAARNAEVEQPFKPELPEQQPLPKVAPVQVGPQAPARPPVDPLVEMNEAFERAMDASRLLTPVDQSAKHYIEEMVAAKPDHELTQRAQLRLAGEFLSRAKQSLEALDTEAAAIWIDEAEGLGADPEGVRGARSSLAFQLVAMESAKPVPASALKVATYVAPEYPQRALERRLEGWVDVEFTVGTDGGTQDVTVVSASHDSYFRKEATAAVEKWRFEPRIFMNRPIEQRSYTRIRFVL